MKVYSLLKSYKGKKDQTSNTTSTDWKFGAVDWELSSQGNSPSGLCRSEEVPGEKFGFVRIEDHLLLM